MSKLLLCSPRLGTIRIPMLVKTFWLAVLPVCPAVPGCVATWRLSQEMYSNQELLVCLPLAMETLLLCRFNFQGSLWFQC
jgi:hypothetical protein